jgi:Mg2+/Co2+ transporter CorB
VEPEPAPEPKRKAKRTPALGGMPASILTGAFIGLLLVGLTWGSLHLCELLRGTSACGKPGFLVLLAIMIILVVVGALLLKAWGVSDPGATSFLGVGLVAVLLLLFLVEMLFNWWMVIVVPILGMVSFALAYWLSTAFVETD